MKPLVHPGTIDARGANNFWFFRVVVIVRIYAAVVLDRHLVVRGGAGADGGCVGERSGGLVAERAGAARGTRALGHRGALLGDLAAGAP